MTTTTTTSVIAQFSWATMWLILLLSLFTHMEVPFLFCFYKCIGR